MLQRWLILPLDPITEATHVKKILAALAVVCLLVLPLAAISDAHETRGITAHDIMHAHERHGHAQWNHGAGTEGHTWQSYRREAQLLRDYLRAVQRAREEERRRADLVRRWSGVADCESGGNWAINTGNGYLGGLQFSLSTWRAYGGAGLPHQQAPWYQAQIADNVRVSSGLHHWPVCGSRYRS